jgi:cobalamin biosynthesis Mg chelatase CobN
MTGEVTVSEMEFISQDAKNFSELLERFAVERDKRYAEMFKTQKDMSDQRFADQAIATATAFAANEKAIVAAFVANEKLVTAAFNANEKATSAALAAAKEAVAKAEAASEKRFESVNEFRGQLKDQAASFVTRDEYSAKHDSLSDKLDAATELFSDRLDRATRELNSSISSLAASRATNEGKALGRTELWALIVAAATVIALLAGLYLKMP